MMTQSDWVWLIFAFFAFVLVWLFIRWTKMHNYRLGQAAYRDRLPRNPKWGKEILQGYDVAKEGQYEP